MEYGTVWKVEVEYAPLHKNYGLGLTTWSPLTSSVISGKCSKGNIPEGNHFALENYKVGEWAGILLKENHALKDFMGGRQTVISSMLGDSFLSVILRWEEFYGQQVLKN
jgi:hypothetical protein